MSTEIKCPYCGHEFEYEDEGECGQDEVLHIECHNEKCEKTFTGTGYYEFYITNIDKADCLNDGDHQLKKSVGVPDNFTAQYRCQSCDDHGNIERFKKHVIIS